MGDEDDSTRPPERISNKPEPPYQALFPEFDKMGRSSFEKRTVSRRRINRALLLLALIPIGVLAAILLPQLLQARRQDPPVRCRVTLVGVSHFV